MTARPARANRGDRGQIALLTVGFMLVLVILVAVVISASRVFLYQRALASATDGAAIFAVNQLDESVVYAHGAGEQLPISADRAAAAVASYVERARLDQRFDHFGYDVSTDGVVVSVTFTATVAVPLVGSITDRYEGGITITTTAAAIAPTRG